MLSVTFLVKGFQPACSALPQIPILAPALAAALARRRALIDEVWGHLPPAMRERLLNVGSDKLLPKYEDQIRRYYEALAEPDKPGLRR